MNTIYLFSCIGFWTNLHFFFSVQTGRHLKRTSSLKLIIEMEAWGNEYLLEHSEPATILVISDDDNVKYAMKELRSKGFKMILAYVSANNSLIGVFDHSVHWPNLVSSGEPFIFFLN